MDEKWYPPDDEKRCKAVKEYLQSREKEMTTTSKVQKTPSLSHFQKRVNDAVDEWLKWARETDAEFAQQTLIFQTPAHQTSGVDDIQERLNNAVNEWSDRVNEIDATDSKK